jgi:hypothetical protein
MVRVVVLAGLFAISAFPVAAQALCGDRDEIIKHLNQGYEEAPTGMGIAANGGVLELLTSDGGSWSILITMPNGGSCIVATGDAWEDIKRLAFKKPNV